MDKNELLKHLKFCVKLPDIIDIEKLDEDQCTLYPISHGVYCFRFNETDKLFIIHGNKLETELLYYTYGGSQEFTYGAKIPANAYDVYSSKSLPPLTSEFIADVLMQEYYLKEYCKYLDSIGEGDISFVETEEGWKIDSKNEFFKNLDVLFIIPPVQGGDSL